MALDRIALRVELTRRGLRQLDLAQRLGVPLSTLGSWLRGAHPGPGDLAPRIEVTLGLQPSSLSPNATPPLAGSGVPAGDVDGTDDPA